ncbi:MAG TPA: FtsX-like permease family protein [Clostridiaceae bacterium]
MKPLSSYTYIKSNSKKVLPSFICTIISVFLIYLFGLLLFGSLADIDKSSTNVVSKSTILYTNDKSKPISDKIISDIKSDPNVKDVIPFLGMNNNTSFNYSAVFGSSSIDSFIFYSEDVGKILKNFNLKLVSGTIPKDNADEILLPLEFTKQYKLKLGDYLNNVSSPDIHFNKTYKLVGITKGEVWIPIVCDVGVITREDALKVGMGFFFKDGTNMGINDKIIALKEKNIIILDYKSIKEIMDQTQASINVLYIFLDIIILLVLCISLGNLNYIVFLGRKNEFAIMSTIGFTESKLRRKLFIENTTVCLIGFIVGIGLTTLTTELLNIAVWQPNGQHIPVFRLDSFCVALIIPAIVSLFSMVSSVREFNKLSYESLCN